MDNFKLWEQYSASCREMMQCWMEQTVKQSDTLQKQVGENMGHVLNLWTPPTFTPTQQENTENQDVQNSDEPPPSTSKSSSNGSGPACKPEPVWTFRGYQLQPGNFTTAMVHFFRAETYRADLWRRRLDTTTNWAVITTAATLSLSWDPRIIILNTLLITLFLVIEARRYRYYELWSYRVRLMETDFFAAMLVPPFRPAPDWAESLAENLLRPQFPISMWEAFGRRFRRNYIWIYMILWVAWFLSIWLHPTPVTTWAEFAGRAAIGGIPAWGVMLIGLAFNGVLITTGLITRNLKEASGEVFQADEELAASAIPRKQPAQTQPRIDWRAWFRPSHRRETSVAFIVTNAAKDVADTILQQMGRGATALNGKGMYTEEEHTVLMCALTSTEMSRLRRLVSQIDSDAFIIASPAQEVFGKGFWPLDAEKPAI